MSAQQIPSARLPTAFTAMLEAAVGRVPGARGAVFLDAEGESVDEFTESTRTSIRLVGAHLGVLLQLARERDALWGKPVELLVEAERATILVLALDERYLVVLEADPGASVGLMRRELMKAAEQLRSEM